ncbi:hypothetical protein [Hoyosella altamirensis]|uniref:Uncharacterized protein n=1 Tax=Hoyosella altamirensis TaxID=616997 RepID=A0A839RUX2_9ACTN|nr:hypothetical protein [Hoyosella altamirensis]MBB3039601.1 hypothetical protein [Hoyosella altamirensis]
MVSEIRIKFSGWIKFGVTDQQALRDSHLVKLHEIDDPEGKLGEPSIEQLSDLRVAAMHVVATEVNRRTQSLPGLEQGYTNLKVQAEFVPDGTLPEE